MVQCVAPYRPVYEEGVGDLFGSNGLEKVPKLLRYQVNMQPIPRYNTL